MSAEDGVPTLCGTQESMQLQLTKQHLEELYEAFCYYANGLDKIPNRKLGELLRALGQNPTDVELQVGVI